MEEIISKLESKDFFNSEETFSIFKLCSQLIIEDEQKAQKLLVNILNNRSKFESSLNPILSDLVEALGFYPYLEKEQLQLDSTNSLIRQNIIILTILINSYMKTKSFFYHS
ncbi:hypothetical protein OKW96_20505 [Sphingobacterium sp. KU25419]|nr:hypothetical protein OKW96_20505 [Sphingobacterium sp. KU25419]